MLYVSYDFSDNKVRAKFSKFLQKYGRRVQYSLFLIHNSQRVLQNILTEIELKYKDKFTGADSIIIVPVTPADESKIIKYGYAENEDKEVLIFT